jgi:hypothetical protein
MPQEPDPPSLEQTGLSGVSARPLERVPIRTRSGTVTRSAWRLEVTSDQGIGSVIVAEAEETYYRGEGLFLGWSQERLALIYKALLPRSNEPPIQVPQLG